ncbi:MAG TPA: RNA methyltransferase [Myxococcales bacterium]|jgi:tRNA (guanosine-2'-O-)-methyltransferase
MSPRRPPRAWIGRPLSTDPSELIGPRGLTAEVLAEAVEPEAATLSRGADDGAPTGDAAFYWSLFTPERKARIETVVASRLRSLTVVLDRLLDAHNTAAIFRTAEGLGLSTAHVVLHESDDGIAHRRVTQDAHKWIDVDRHETGVACARALREKGFEVWAGHLDDNAILYGELPRDRPLALLFGNEHEGPSRETLSACTGTFRIPMAGFTQSFNVSVAAGIALAHAAQARRAFLHAPGDLDDDEQALLKSRFTLLAAKLSRRLKR